MSFPSEMTSPGLESPVTSWKLAGQAKEYPPLAFLLWLEVYKGPDFPCPTPALCPSPLTARDTVIHLSGGCSSTLLPEPLLHPEGHLLGSPGPGAHHGLGPAVVVTQASFLAASIPQADVCLGVSVFSVPSKVPGSRLVLRDRLRDNGERVVLSTDG